MHTPSIVQSSLPVAMIGLPNMQLSPAIAVTAKMRTAYNKLFGDFPPHYSIARLTGFNSTALTNDFKYDIRRVLSHTDAGYFYGEREDTVIDIVRKSTGKWEDGLLLHNWQKTAAKANPHHILPRSRGGNGSKRNLRHVCRKTHDYFHTIFTNLTPAEQIGHMLAISPVRFNLEFILDVMKILIEKDPLYFYKKSIFLPKIITTLDLNKAN